MNGSLWALTGMAMLLLLIVVVRLLPKPVWLLPMLIYLAVGAVWSGVQPELYVPAVTEEFVPLLKLLAEAGLVMMLFQAGLDANLTELKRQLALALKIWLSNVGLSALLGFACAMLLGFSLISALFIAVALTATSVGVPVALWGQAGQLNTEAGSLLLEVAELDDISTVLLMAILVAMVPLLQPSSSQHSLAEPLLQMSLMMVGFVAIALIFARYLAPILTHWVRSRANGHELLQAVLAVSLLLAVLSEVAGLSLAIGAFLAGLAFSGDRAMQAEKTLVQRLTDLFSPFFFIGLGLEIPWSEIGDAGVITLVLLTAAIVGKLVGTALPMWSQFGRRTSLLVGMSMVPRSEVAMIVMQKGLSYGLDPRAFVGMLGVVVGTVLLTSLTVPLALARKADTARQSRASEG